MEYKELQSSILSCLKFLSESSVSGSSMCESTTAFMHKETKIQITGVHDLAKAETISIRDDDLTNIVNKLADLCTTVAQLSTQGLFTIWVSTKRAISVSICPEGSRSKTLSRKNAKRTHRSIESTRKRPKASTKSKTSSNVRLSARKKDTGTKGNEEQKKMDPAPKRTEDTGRVKTKVVVDNDDGGKSERGERGERKRTDDERAARADRADRADRVDRAELAELANEGERGKVECRKPRTSVNKDGSDGDDDDNSDESNDDSNGSDGSDGSEREEDSKNGSDDAKDDPEYRKFLEKFAEEDFFEGISGMSQEEYEEHMMSLVKDSM